MINYEKFFKYYIKNYTWHFLLRYFLRLIDSNSRLNVIEYLTRSIYTLNLQITCADREYFPGPYVAVIRVHKSPRCISPAVDNALPSRRIERGSSIPSSINPPRYRIHCEIKCISA